MPRDPDDGLPGARKRDDPDRLALKHPPSEMSKEYQELYNAPNEMGGYRKGGKVKKTGAAKVHKGEQVVKRSSAQKYGAKKMAAVNRGTARISTRKR